MPQKLPVTTPDKPMIPISDIIACADKGLSVRQIGKLLGCSHPNVVQRLQTCGYRKDRADWFRSNKDRVFEHVQQQIIESITSADTTKSGLRDKVIAAAVLDDKIRIHRGQATSIVEHSSITAELDAIMAKRASIQAQLDKLQGYEEREASTIDVTPSAPCDTPEQAEPISTADPITTEHEQE